MSMLSVSPVSSSASSSEPMHATDGPAAELRQYATLLAQSIAPSAPVAATSSAGGVSSLQSVNVIPPSALTAGERINGRPTIYGPEGGIGAPDTPGNALSEALESVQAKTSEYESKFDAAASGGKNEYGSVTVEKDGLQPTARALGAPSAETKGTNDGVNSQIDRYMGMMRQGYEYYIFTSMTIDIGKDVSQTANGLTKG